MTLVLLAGSVEDVKNPFASPSRRLVLILSGPVTALVVGVLLNLAAPQAANQGVLDPNVPGTVTMTFKARP